MKSYNEIVDFLAAGVKEKERILNTKIRNGQHIKGINEAISWVLKEGKT